MKKRIVFWIPGGGPSFWWGVVHKFGDEIIFPTNLDLPDSSMRMEKVNQKSSPKWWCFDGDESHGTNS